MHEHHLPYRVVRRITAIAALAFALTFIGAAATPSIAEACQGRGERCGFRKCCGGLSCGPIFESPRVCYDNPRQLGQPCSAFNRCAGGLCCGYDGRCRASGTSGQPCASCPENRCTGGTSCGPAGNQNCYSTPRRLGEPCSSTACADGLSCGPISDRVCYHSPRRVGEPCSSTPCADGLCCGADLTCKEEAGSGEACACPARTGGGCEDGLSCGPVTESPRTCYHTPRELGEPCSSTACGDGLSCGPISNRVCFHYPRQLGEPCSSTPCAAGLCCGGDLTCKDEGALGEACACPNRDGDGGCEVGLSCGPISESPRTCYHSPRRLGEPCSAFNACEGGLSCGPVGDQYCYHSPRQLGEPCSAFNKCGAGLYCSLSYQCEERAGLGESCDGEVKCLEELSCGPFHDRKCYNVPREYGEPCSAFNTCADGLSCQPGVQRCYNNPRQLEEPCSAGFECDAGLSCQPGVQKCYNNPRQLGEPCSAGFGCGDGLSCHPGVQRCFHEPREFEEPCSAGFECGDGLSCQPGVQKCYHVPRRYEEPCSLGFECGECLSCQPGVHKCYNHPRTAGEPCSVGFPCGDEGFICHPLLLRCTPPEGLGADDANACAALYSHTLAQGAIDAGSAIGYSVGGAVSSGVTGSFEEGVVYGDDGEFGCFAAWCYGVETDISASAFFTVALVDSWGDFAGESLVTSVGVGIPFLNLFGFTTAQIFTTDLTRLLGTAQSISIGVDADVSPVAVGAADCTTVVYEVPIDLLPDPEPRCDCEDISAPDTDDDGYNDCVDLCPNDPEMAGPTPCRDCGEPAVDSDGDGVEDCLDGCPDDATKLEAGDCGCGAAEDDTDQDGTPDCVDGCPNNADLIAPDGHCGCLPSNSDSDGDGVVDCRDGCPFDEGKVDAGVCGCGVPDADADADGEVDPCADGCPNDPDKDAPGICGCGAPDPAGALDPVLACTDGQAECTGPATAVATNATAIDLCGGSLAATASGTGPYPLGATTVTWSAVDADGRAGSCTATATVTDTTAPALTCVPARAECVGAATSATPTAAATDTCEGPLPTAIDDAGPYPPGLTTVTLSATDGSGNVGTCSTTVTIVDTTAPTAACTGGTRECLGASTDVATTCTGADTCDGDVALESTAGASYGLGTHTFTCTAVDDSGNVDVATCEVVIVDTTAPTVACVDDDVLTLSGDTCQAAGTYTVAALDTCEGPDSETHTFNFTAPGSASYEYGFADASGNDASCTQIVTAVDTTAPAATCPTDATLELSTDACTATAAYNATATDACSGELLDTHEFTFTTAGAETHAYRFVDESGNETTCEQTVTAIDVTPPIATCPADGTVELSADTCTATATYVAAATDACAGDLSATFAYEFATVESQTHDYVLSDASGNAATCSQTVSALDVTPPTLICSAPIVVDCAGQDGAPATVGATATDACDIAPAVTNTWTESGADASAVYPLGVTTVTFTAIDAWGNVATCDTTVEVRWTPWSFAIYTGRRDVTLHGGAHVVGDVFSADDLRLSRSATVEGLAYAFGDVRVDRHASVEPGAYLDGRVRGGGHLDVLGAVPDSVPAPPALDTAWYDDLIDQADAEPWRNQRYHALDLAGGYVFVDGNVTVRRGGHLSGPGVLVATGHIRLERGVVVGDDVTLVAGKRLSLHRGVTVGAGALLYARRGVTLDRDATVASGSLLTPGAIRLARGAIVSGLVLGLDGVHLHRDVQVFGSVITLDGVHLHAGATVTHGCAALPAAFPPPGLGEGVGFPPPAPHWWDFGWFHGCGNG